MGLGRRGVWLALLACGCVQSTLGERAVQINPRDAGDGGELRDAMAPDAMTPDAMTMPDAGMSDAADDAGRDASQDTGTDAFVYDAGCEGEDPDRDGVCSDQDNCPNLKNPTQLDTDGDGKGDPCDPCNAEVIAEPHRLAGGSVTRVAINGDTNSVDVAPGQEFDVAVEFVFDRCIIGVPVALQVGLEVGNAACLVSTLCPGQAGTADITLTAPTEPGLYYVLARMPEAVTCAPPMFAPWGSPTLFEARIAAVCVH